MREAIAEFLARREEQEQEAIERATITKRRALLARQAKAMVAEQAKPHYGGVTARRRGIPMTLE